MQNKTALIVDDSRTACQMLRLMLEREEFQVDVLGSAEDAIGYLQDHRPGIIFMDHLMPGMDGFQAVKEIKNSSATAAIPIVMYTAKSGDLYVGQAHALGAVDILPKPPTRESLRAVFRRIDERSDTNGNGAAAAAATAADGAAAAVAVPAVEVVDDSGPMPEADAEHAPRAPERNNVPVPASAPEFMRDDSDESGAVEESGPRVSWWLALAAAAASFVAGMQFPARSGDSTAYLDALAWALDDGMPYAFEDSPFGGERVERIRGLVERLAAAGFAGTVRLEGHAGQFCLVASPGGWRVPDPALPIESCDTIGLNNQEARQNSGRQAPEFRAFLQETQSLGHSGIKVEVEAVGDRKPRREYPAHDQVASAGDWNRIAAQNNRVTVTLIPRP